MESGKRDFCVALSGILLIVGVLFSYLSLAHGNYLLNIPAIALWMISTGVGIAALPRT